MHYIQSPLQHIGSFLWPLWKGRSSQPRLLSFFQAVQDYEMVCYRCTSYARDHIESNHDSTPWLWLRDHVAAKPTSTQFIYQLIVSFLSECNCLAFKDMISKFGRKRNLFLHYKHLYFIFVKVSNVDHEVDLFIYAPIFSFNEVKLILEGGLLT